MSGKKVVVLGGTGFVGRAVVNELSKNGYTTDVTVRRPERYREFLLFPNTQLVQLDDMQDAEALTKVLKGADVVVNMVSDLTSGTEAVAVDDLVKVNQQIKKAIESAEVHRVMTLSQIGADANNAKNNWLCVLGESDAVMHTVASADVTIMRAGMLLGEGDDAVCRFRTQLSRFPVLPIANSGVEVQPLALTDFALAMVNTIKDESAYGQKIEVVGEERLSLKTLGGLVKDMMDKEDAIVLPMCSLNAKFMAMLGPLAPAPTVSKTQLMSLSTDQISDTDFATRFGFVPMSIDQTLARYVISTNVRERYHYFRKEAGRDADELV